jgi:cytochrome c-type biogenesis protein CcmH/NrfG
VYYRILFDEKKYQQGEQVLYDVLARNPSVAIHWRMLASHYLQLEESREGLAALMLSYLSGQVGKSGDLLQIVSLYGYLDVPEKAARMLEQFIEEGKVESDADTSKQLGTLWLLARERAKAKASLQTAASEAPDGSTYAMLGGIYFDDEEWPAAYDAYQQALRLGGLNEPLRITMLAGISAYYAGMMDEARSSLQDAAKSDNYRQQAESLLKKIDEA